MAPQAQGGGGVRDGRAPRQGAQARQPQQQQQFNQQQGVEPQQRRIVDEKKPKQQAGRGAQATTGVSESPAAARLASELAEVLEPYGYSQADIMNLVVKCNCDAAHVQTMVSNILDDKRGHEQGEWSNKATASERKARAQEAKERREQREREIEMEREREKQRRQKVYDDQHSQARRRAEAESAAKLKKRLEVHEVGAATRAPAWGASTAVDAETPEGGEKNEKEAEMERDRERQRRQKAYEDQQAQAQRRAEAEAAAKLQEERRVQREKEAEIERERERQQRQKAEEEQQARRRVEAEVAAKIKKNLEVQEVAANTRAPTMRAPTAAHAESPETFAGRAPRQGAPARQQPQQQQQQASQPQQHRAVEPQQRRPAGGEKKPKQQAGRGGQAASGAPEASVAARLASELAEVLEPYGYSQADIMNLVIKCNCDESRVQTMVSDILDDKRGHEQGEWSNKATASERKARAAEAKERREQRDREIELERERERQRRQKAYEDQQSQARRRAEAESAAKLKKRLEVQEVAATTRAPAWGAPAAVDAESPETLAAAAADASEEAAAEAFDDTPCAVPPAPGSWGDVSTQDPMIAESHLQLPEHEAKQQEHLGQDALPSSCEQEPSTPVEPWLHDEKESSAIDAAAMVENDWAAPAALPRGGWDSQDADPWDQPPAAATSQRASWGSDWATEGGTSWDPDAETAAPTATHAAVVPPFSVGGVTTPWTPEPQGANSVVSMPHMQVPPLEVPAQDSCSEDDDLDSPTVMPPSYAALRGTGPEPNVMFGSLHVQDEGPPPSAGGAAATAATAAAATAAAATAVQHSDDGAVPVLPPPGTHGSAPVDAQHGAAEEREYQDDEWAPDSEAWGVTPGAGRAAQEARAPRGDARGPRDSRKGKGGGKGKARSGGADSRDWGASDGKGGGGGKWGGAREGEGGDGKGNASRKGYGKGGSQRKGGKSQWRPERRPGGGGK